MKKLLFTFNLILGAIALNATHFYVKQGNPISNNALTVPTAAGLKPNGALPNSILNNVKPGDFKPM